MTFESMLPWALGLAVPFMLMWLRKLWADKTDARMELVDRLVTIAYHVTDEVSRLTPNKVDDKIAFALGELNRLLKANRKRELTPGETELAKAKWSAMHALESKAAGAPPLVALTSAPIAPVPTPPERPRGMPPNP